MTLCACGCGQEIIQKSKYRISKYIYHHHLGGKNHPMYGKHHTKESKQKNREAHLNKLVGNNNPAKRLDVRKKISEVKKSQHKKLTINTKIKISNSRKNKCMGINNPNWKGGITNHPYCEKWNETLRERIRNQYDRKCYNCGKNEKNNITKSGKIYKLAVHHIDMDKEQGCNGKQWKLVPLCIHYHSKQHIKKYNTN